MDEPQGDLRVAQYGESAPTQSRSDIAEIRAAASVLIERLQFMRQAGITFEGSRDLYEVLGYARLISTKNYRDRYARGGITKRIVEAFPNATWRGTMELVEDEDPKVSTPFEAAWETLEKRLKITSLFRRADILAGLSTYSVMLIGVAGNLPLDQELPRGKKPEDLLFLTPFSGGGGPGLSPRAQSGNTYVDATILEFDRDVTSPRFGLPLTYQLKRIDLSSPELNVPVHWSRVLHFAEGILDDEVYGTPTLEACWNLLDDLDKVTGGGAEAFWLRANQGLQLDVSADVKLDPKVTMRALKEEVEAYRHNQSRILKTRGVKASTLGSDVANFSNPADAILTQIAGTKGIPKRVLTGSEMGELASSQDRDNWKDQIDGRQQQYAGPYMVRQLADRLIAYGYLPEPKEYNVRWPHIQTLTEQEKAAGAKDWAGVNATAGVTVFTADEIRDKWYSMAPAEESDLEAYKAAGAEKWAMVNKTQGATIFTDDEIRDKWYGFKPLTPEQKVPITAPERVSASAPTPEGDKAPDQPAIPGKPAPGAPPIAAPVTRPTLVKPTAVPKAAEHAFGSTQINLSGQLMADVLAYGASIPDAQLAADGRELTPHVTVKYGLNESDPELVQVLLANYGPITLSLGRIGFFSAPDYDVLIINVESADLFALNELITENLETTVTQSTYQPHVTIAYLQPGQGVNYAGDKAFVGRRFSADTVVLSSADDALTDIDLGATPVAAESAHGIERELLQVLEAAIQANNVEVIDRILGTNHEGDLVTAGDVEGHPFHGNQHGSSFAVQQEKPEHQHAYERGYYHGQTSYGFQKHEAGRKGSAQHAAYRRGYDHGVDDSYETINGSHSVLAAKAPGETTIKSAGSVEESTE